MDKLDGLLTAIKDTALLLIAINVLFDVEDIKDSARALKDSIEELRTLQLSSTYSSTTTPSDTTSLQLEDIHALYPSNNKCDNK